MAKKKPPAAEPVPVAPKSVPGTDAWPATKPSMRPVAQLVPAARNARTHSREQIEKIVASIREWGWTNPLLIDEQDGIIAGHGRVLAAQQLGIEAVPVIVASGWSDAQKRAYLIADNKLALESGWDRGILAMEFGELAALDFNLELTGFEGKELRGLLSLFESKQGDINDPGPLEPPESPTSRVGDLWLLGNHRILAGDSTKFEDVRRLMAGEKATLLATDPPYLVDYRGGNHPQSWANKPDVKDKDWDDYKDPTSGLEFFVGWLAAWLPECSLDVPVYQWHATRRQVLVERAWEKHDLLVHQTIIWVKARPVLTRSHYMWQHEPCFYGWRKGHMPKRPPANERTVWQIDQVGEQDGIHPTQKPVAIFERPIMFHTEHGDVVAEPFSGSGTQLIAAEKTGRRCRAMEISLPFVDAGVRRWEQATKKQATLEGDGRTFTEIAVERAAAAEVHA